jgi:hypothetical protein
MNLRLAADSGARKRPRGSSVEAALNGPAVPFASLGIARYKLREDPAVDRIALIIKLPLLRYISYDEK